MPAQRGHLILADISGYTAFVADTELEHSREILNELLETTVRCMGQHLTIGQIEGDAVFGLGEKLPADPLAWLQDCFFQFHRHLNLIKRVTTCPCRACANVGILTLKFVCHHGEYMPQVFSGRQTYVGSAVNTAHRLLKNSLPSREYVLLTRTALEQLGPAAGAAFQPHVERYDVGELECGWMDLSPLRSDPRAQEEPRSIDEEHAEMRNETWVDAPKDRVWQVLTDPASRQRWMGVTRVDYKPGARHTLVGAEYHCLHGKGDIAVFRVSEALEPDRLTMAVPLMGLLMWCTVQLEDAGPGRTKMITRYRFESKPGLIGALKRFAFIQMGKRDFLTKYPVAIARMAEASALVPAAL